MTNKNIIYCTIYSEDCNRNTIGKSGEITKDKEGNYSCNVLENGNCAYLVELKNKENIFNALEKLVKILE